MSGGDGHTAVIADEPLLTAEDLVRLHGGDSVELIEGVVHPLLGGDCQHGSVCAELSFMLYDYVHAHEYGRIAINFSFVLTKRNPDTVRGPDIVAYSYRRLPKGPMPDGLLETAPNIVVEVVGSTERWGDILPKIPEFLAAGAEVVVTVDVKTESAHIWRNDQPPEPVGPGGTLTLPDVLPGFSMPLAKLFR